MELFIRLLVWILNYTYPSRRTGAASAQSALDEAVLRKHQEESEARRKDQLVENFKSDTTPFPGAVDYQEMKWDSFSRVVETQEQFVFYGERSVAKTIPKIGFSTGLELVTLRRMIRRHVRDHRLLD